MRVEFHSFCEGFIMAKKFDDDEPFIRLADVPDLEWMGSNRKNRRLSYWAVYDWNRKGRRGVRLKVEVLGSNLVTKESWLRAFFKAVTKARESKLQKA
jgi:hypothetical protein